MEVTDSGGQALFPVRMSTAPRSPHVWSQLPPGVRGLQGSWSLCQERFAGGQAGLAPCPQVRAFLAAWGLLQGAAASPPGAAGLPQGLSVARSLLEGAGWGPCWCEHVREGVCVRASV